MSVARRAILPPPQPTRRRDIQGLRAVAVAAVIAFHVLGAPGGGFLGVDVFFVVSGFVITGVLLRRADATASVDLGAFYLRRARRILPLSLVVIAATLVASRATWAPEKADAVALDGLWSALFAANWRFASQAADYFHLGSAPSPLTHFWSLGVEEQFYLVWPGLIALTWWLSRGAARRVTRGATTTPRVARAATLRTAVLAVAVPIAAASLALGAWQVPAAPTLAYYSSLTRAWELALGCILAALPALRLHPAARTVLSWMGLAGIVAAFAWANATVGVPVPGSLAACGATAVVLLAGTGEEPRGAWLLANPVATYLGDISYGLYLWHFPIAVIGAAWIDRGTPTFALGAVALTLALAAISYHLFERPILDGRLRPRPMIAAAAALALLAGTAVGANALAPRWWDAVPAGPSTASPAPTASEVPPTPTPTPTASSTPTTTATPTPTPAVTEVPLGATGQALRDGLKGGLSLSSWPADLTPNKPEGGGNPWPGVSACEATKVSSQDSCTFGNPDGPEIDVYGDSLAINLLVAVEAAYGETHKIRGLTKLACAVNGVDADFGQPDWAAPCVNHRLAVIDYVNRTHPKILFMTETYNWSLKLLSGATGTARAAEWAAADQAFVDAIAGSGTQVVITSPSIDGVAYYDCYRAGGSPQKCTTSVPSWWRPIQDAERHIRGATFLDTLHWYCVDGRCPMISTASGHMLMKVDYIHVTYAYDRLVAADLKWRVEALGVTP